MRNATPKQIEALRRLHEDPELLPVLNTKFQWWSVCGTIQLACRHPSFRGPTRKIVEDFAIQVFDRLSKGDPVLQEISIMGWQAGFDAKVGSDRWLIWSNEHNKWWAKNELGYVENIHEAGRYSFERASEICEHANIARSTNQAPNETMLPAPEIT